MSLGYFSFESFSDNLKLLKLNTRKKPVGPFAKKNLHKFVCFKLLDYLQNFDFEKFELGLLEVGEFLR